MMSEQDLHAAIGQWLYGVQPQEDERPATFGEVIATWRERGGPQWERKYQTDPSFRAVLDAATAYTAQLERERSQLFAALSGLWRVHRTMGHAHPGYQPTLSKALEDTYNALRDGQHPGDPEIAD